MSRCGAGDEGTGSDLAGHGAKDHVAHVAEIIQTQSIPFATMIQPQPFVFGGFK